MRRMTGLPSIASHVLAFCDRISPGSKPVLVGIRPEARSKPRECFHNVRRKVESEGGRIRFGWALWEWPHVFIEAEHHAVYEAPNGGPLLDLTPSTEDDPQTARLFLPDDSATYDFQHPDARRDHIRQALAQDPLIDEYFHLASERVQIMSRTPGNGRVTVPATEQDRVVFIAKRIAALQRQIAMKYTAMGAPCFCGSGKKFKRCCGSSTI